jgi:hypothetical protein
LEKLRDFAASNGIPSYSSKKGQVTSEERRGFFLWLFARHVTEEEYNLSESQTKLDDVAVRSLLCRGGWYTCDGQMIHYTAVSSDRERGKDVFRSLEEVARKITLDKEIVKEGTLSSQDILGLRLWSLRHPKELNKDYRTPTKRRRGMTIHCIDDCKKARVTETESPMVAATACSTVQDAEVIDHTAMETESPAADLAEPCAMHDTEGAYPSEAKTVPMVASPETVSIHQGHKEDRPAARTESTMAAGMASSHIDDVVDHLIVEKQDVGQELPDSRVVESKSDVSMDQDFDEAQTVDETPADHAATQGSLNAEALSTASAPPMLSNVPDGELEANTNGGESAIVDDNKDASEMKSSAVPLLTQLEIDDDEVSVEDDDSQDEQDGESDEGIPGHNEGTSTDTHFDEAETKSPAAPLLTQAPQELENESLSMPDEDGFQVEKTSENSESLLEDSGETPMEAGDDESAMHANTLPILTQPGAEMESDDESTQEEDLPHLPVEKNVQIEETSPGEYVEGSSEVDSREEHKAVGFEDSGHARLNRGLRIEDSVEENEAGGEDSKDPSFPLTQAWEDDDPIIGTRAQEEMHEGTIYESDISINTWY